MPLVSGIKPHITPGIHRCGETPTLIRATGLDTVIAPLMLTNVDAMAGSPSAALIVLLVLALSGPVAAGQ